jgi:hypothetical protein
MFPYVTAGCPTSPTTMRALGRRIGVKARRTPRRAKIEQQLAAMRHASRRAAPKTLLVFGRERDAAARERQRRLRVPARHARDRGRRDVLGDLQPAVGRHEHRDDLTRAPDVISSCITASR